jgi:hypothetical protein
LCSFTSRSFVDDVQPRGYTDGETNELL